MHHDVCVCVCSVCLLERTLPLSVVVAAPSISTCISLSTSTSTSTSTSKSMAQRGSNDILRCTNPQTNFIWVPKDKNKQAALAASLTHIRIWPYVSQYNWGGGQSPILLEMMMTSRVVKSRAELSPIRFSMAPPVRLWWARQTSKPLVKLTASEFSTYDTERNNRASLTHISVSFSKTKINIKCIVVTHPLLEIYFNFNLLV